MLCRIAVTLAVSSALLAAQSTLTEVKLQVVPASKKIRPLETAAIQVQAIGTVDDGRGSTRTGRLQRDGWKASVREPEGGWVSKPFLFQGTEPNPVEYVDRKSSSFGALFGQALNQYTVKDTTLYVAPAKPGKYTVQVELAGKKAEVVIEVSADVPSQRIAEQQNFAAEKPSSDPYRKLAEHWAPFLAQETWFVPKADMITRFDYDGDWKGDNNWDDLEKGTSQAYVHYAVMETATHVFLIYNFFHPRDYSDNCIIGSCHENDNEGAVLAIQKDGSEFGRLQVLETLAHNNVYDYTNDPGLQNGIQDIDGAIVFWKDSHPMLFLEAGGHGAYAANDRRSLFNVQTRSFNNTGITYEFKGVAERPKTAVDKEVGYELLPIYENWWVKSQDAGWKQPTFDEYYDYAPFGNRPRMQKPHISGAFLGRKQAVNKARPFWGWFDNRSRKAGAVNTGQWALDPAWSVTRNLKFPPKDAFSLDYTFNPYLDLDVGGKRASMGAPRGFAARNFNVPAVAAAKAGAGSPLASGGGGFGGILGAAIGDERTQSMLGGVLEKVGVGSVATDQLKHAGASVGGAPLSASQAEAAPAQTSPAPAAAPAAPSAPTTPAAPSPKDPPAPTAPAAPAPAGSTGGPRSASDALSAMLSAPNNQCVIVLSTNGPGELVLRGDHASFLSTLGSAAKENPSMQCTTPLPRSEVQFRVERRTGAGAVKLAQTGSAANDFTTRVAVTAAGGTTPERYEIVLRW